MRYHGLSGILRGDQGCHYRRPREPFPGAITRSSVFSVWFDRAYIRQGAPIG